MKIEKLQLLFALVLLYTASTSYADKPETCKNGGKPLSGDHPKCSCPHGYKGYDCGQRVTPCEGEPCRHGGRCQEKEDGTFYCLCPVNYDGLLCEKRVRPCDSNPCQNGGKCSDDGLKCFKCECISGFKGSNCAQKILPCEVSPCKNGGICSNEGGSFKCACQNGFGGLICNEKDALYSSVILKGEDVYRSQLHQWLNNEEDWRLCYRASRDGWRAADFHLRCDHKGPTVTIINVGHYIFGGYSDISWGGSTGYKQTSKSFLFSLRNKDKLKPFKAIVYKNSGNAIYQKSSYGPTFGGGHDLHISDNSHTTTGSYSSFGHTYKPPSGYVYNQQNTKHLLAGSYNFIPNEIEVFYLR